MSNSVYAINKGINKSIEFKGLKAQYIWYLAGGVMGLLLLFAGLAIIGVNQYICVILILPLGGAMVLKVYRLSNKYGEHGMMKEMARRSVPGLIKSKSRSVFYTGNQDGRHSDR